MSAALQENIDDALERVVSHGERVVLHEGGKEIAVIMPIEDLALLEQIEDLLDNEEADKALAEMKASGEQPIPIEVIKKKLGLA
jgi:PHD/YefM family antitoxin component YafN of YafNO toxin-antitoxin module